MCVCVCVCVTVLATKTLKQKSVIVFLVCVCFPSFDQAASANWAQDLDGAESDNSDRPGPPGLAAENDSDGVDDAPLRVVRKSSGSSDGSDSGSEGEDEAILDLAAGALDRPAARPASTTAAAAVLGAGLQDVSDSFDVVCCECGESARKVTTRMFKV